MMGHTTPMVEKLLGHRTLMNADKTPMTAVANFLVEAAKELFSLTLLLQVTSASRELHHGTAETFRLLLLLFFLFFLITQYTMRHTWILTVVELFP